MEVLSVSLPNTKSFSIKHMSLKSITKSERLISFFKKQVSVETSLKLSAVEKAKSTDLRVLQGITVAT